jgi:hypothetical protein
MRAAPEPVVLLGQSSPRVAPPVPARSDVGRFRAVASSIGIDLMSWQDVAARYLEALAPDGRHLYREVAIVVSRQQGKTELLVPLIKRRLEAGRRMMHTAQNRELPREVFGRVADVVDPDLFTERNGRRRRPRYANGQEEIRLANGGVYSIVAPTRGGARGPARDDVIIDEVRELENWDFIAAAKPTLTASQDPQTIYLSNAGTDTSVVLNALRERAAKDPNLAYLEWSAAPDRPSDDRAGWAEANPAIGHERGKMGSVLETLEADYETSRLEGTLAIFETEHLCRWVTSMRQMLVDPAAWALCEAESLPRARRSFVGVSMDPSGTRAAAARAWQGHDGTVNLEMLYDVTGRPIDTADLGRDMAATVTRLRASKVGFDPMTDAELAKFFRETESLAGAKWANASAQFANLVESGRLRWHDANAVGDDLGWTSRKKNDERGSFSAVRASDDRPIPAALAAIRAVWLASGPKPPRPRVY